MSGKAIATSSSSIGLEFCSRRPPPQRMPEPMPRVAAVEDRRQLVLGDHLVDRPGHLVVGIEALHGRMELEALDAVLLDQLARLARAHLALVRIDAAEGDHDVAVLLRRLGDLLVRDAAPAQLRLGVDREHHEADLLLAVVGDASRRSSGGGSSGSTCRRRGRTPRRSCRTGSSTTPRHACGCRSRSGPRCPWRMSPGC